MPCMNTRRKDATNCRMRSDAIGKTMFAYDADAKDKQRNINKRVGDVSECSRSALDNIRQ